MAKALLCVLKLIGFTAVGVGKRTLAALIQSLIYGGSIVGGSIFSIMQSIAMRKW